MDSLVFGILVSIQKIFVRSESQCPDFSAFKIAYVQTIVRSKLHMSRPSCVQNCICPDYRAFKISYVQTIVRSFCFPDRVILNARRHLVRSFRSGHIDFRSGTSTWELIPLVAIFYYSDKYDNLHQISVLQNNSDKTKKHYAYRGQDFD